MQRACALKMSQLYEHGAGRVAALSLSLSLTTE